MADENRDNESDMDADPPPEDGKDETRSDDNQNGGVIGSTAMRPVFLGNLNNNFAAADVKDVFETADPPIAVDRVDIKRGYCFVFLKDAASEADKQRAENFVSDINGMSVPNLSGGLRAEFARGDGRIKRKEDDRRKQIAPSDTLFVVNFHEETTKREDLQMLFEPFGELIRIDLKRNYAFVQFRTIEEATRAKEVTNGGKLDQSVLTVEYVARQRNEGGGERRYRDRDRGRNRGNRGPPPRRDAGREDNRRRSPPRRNDYRRRSRSRSRSPQRYRSRSPPRRDFYDDDRRYRERSPEYRRRSPDRDYRPPDRDYRDRDRGYRP